MKIDEKINYDEILIAYFLDHYLFISAIVRIGIS